ncbi:hypothetical protein SAMN03159495_4468 [Pseudomonas sp. NFR16]|nr:hypothetical protein SAMN03159495_4468 [Pseudomonas sp. NFR16]
MTPQVPQELTPVEYEQMMREFHEAEEWMKDQLKARHVAPTSEHCMRSEDLIGRWRSFRDEQ